MPEPAHKKQLTLASTVYTTPLMIPTADLDLSIHLSMFEFRETGDWGIFLGPPERARAETGGADHWVLKRRELPGFAKVNKLTSASLGYPLSVFNTNSTLKCTILYWSGTWNLFFDPASEFFSTPWWSQRCFYKLLKDCHPASGFLKCRATNRPKKTFCIEISC